MMEQDISKKTIMVLLLLTIVVSAIGTWIALDDLSQNVPVARSDYGNGQVSIGVNVPARNLEGPKFDSISGKVSLNILPNN